VALLPVIDAVGGLLSVLDEQLVNVMTATARTPTAAAGATVTVLSAALTRRDELFCMLISC
jgi:hypothetical protein